MGFCPQSPSCIFWFIYVVGGWFLVRASVVVFSVVCLLVVPVRASLTLADMADVDAQLVDAWGWSMLAQQPAVAADLTAVRVAVSALDPWSASSPDALRTLLVGVSA